ncbi:hypothetical protein GGF46_004429 [Coemansia sp. RSA 552]|nr:hypothetical protein GGF46_004429 [Coemansia sp. RSA 552]
MGAKDATTSEDSQELSTLQWVERSRKRQREQPQPEKPRKKKPVRPEYTSDDLAGLRMAHSVGGLEEGTPQVLTLQDRTIEELDEDEEGARLEDTLAVDRSRARKNAEWRKKARNLANDTAHGVLEEEEEEDHGTLTIRQGGVVELDGGAAADRAERERSGHVAQILEPAGRTAIGDFYTEEEALTLFRPKKPKKSKKVRSGRRTTTNDFGEVDTTRVNELLSRTTQIDDSNFADDDDGDLQRAIASVRRAASKKKKKPRDAMAEDIARRLKESGLRPDGMEVDAGPPEGSEVLSSTMEFIQGLKASVATTPTPAPKAMATTPKAESPITVSAPKDGHMDEDEVKIVKGARDAPKAGGSQRGLALSSRDATEEAPAAPAEEPSVGGGLAGVVSLLRQRNMLESLTAEQREQEERQRGRDEWMAEHRRQEALLQKERQRIKQLGKKPVETSTDSTRSSGRRRGRPDEMTQQELQELKAEEQERLDRRWAQEYEERMRDYKPTVKLEYVDEAGRQLTTKEAYKQLSHEFHGHFSGKNKIDLLRKKREREQRHMELATESTTHRHNAAMEKTHRKIGSAGIVISSSGKTNVGNRSKK